jgi:hypothetical protein
MWFEEAIDNVLAIARAIFGRFVTDVCNVFKGAGDTKPP